MQSAQLHQHVPARFPAVRASNLNRRAFNLPADFESERNLVIVAFQRNQQELVETWTAPIRDLLARYPDLRFFELPTISRRNPLFRAWLDGAMRDGIPDHQSREQTITLYLDKVVFRQALGLPHEDTIYLLLVDREGHVYWRAEGEYSAQLAAELEQVVAGTAQREEAVGGLGRQGGCC
jgi:hypothetical protein